MDFQVNGVGSGQAVVSGGENLGIAGDVDEVDDFGSPRGIVSCTSSLHMPGSALSKAS